MALICNPRKLCPEDHLTVLTVLSSRPAARDIKVKPLSQNRIPELIQSPPPTDTPYVEFDSPPQITKDFKVNCVSGEHKLALRISE